VTSPRALRVVFLGTPEIAVPTLERLLAGPHEVVGVVSQPDRRRGRGRKPSPSPVAEVALREGLPLLRPERLGDEDTLVALRDLQPDLGVVVAFGQFIPKRVRELPRCGYLINAHASLLPRHRGASPIAQAILEGDEETGISVMRVVREMDAGPVGLMLRTPIEPRENTAELSARLAGLAAEAIARAVDLIASDEIEWTEQDERQASVAPKLEKADAILDLRQSAPRLARRIHALSPRPAGLLRLVCGTDGVPTPNRDPSGSDRATNAAPPPSLEGPVEETLKVLRATTSPFEADAAPAPGTLEIDRTSERHPLRIATGGGWLVPETLQRAGGRPLPAGDFLRGFPIPDDARFALPDPGSPTGDDGADGADGGEPSAADPSTEGDEPDRSPRSETEVR